MVVITGLITAVDAVVNGWGAAAVVIPILIGALMKLQSDANTKHRQAEKEMRDSERERSELKAEVLLLRSEARQRDKAIAQLEAEVANLKTELRTYRGRR